MTRAPATRAARAPATREAALRLNHRPAAPTRERTPSTREAPAARGGEETAHYRGGSLHSHSHGHSLGTVNDGNRGDLSDGGNRSDLGDLGNLRHRGGDDDDARSTGNPKLGNLRPCHETTRSSTPGPLPGGGCVEVVEGEEEGHGPITCKCRANLCHTPSGGGRLVATGP